jgi:chromosome segregation ATPase
MLDPKKPEDLAELRRLAGIWKAQDGLPGPDVNRLLDAVPALVDLVEQLGADRDSAVNGQLQLQDHVTSLMEANEQRVKERDATRANLEQARQDLGAEQAAVAQLQAALETARHNARAYEDDLQDARREIRELQADVRAAQEQVDDARGRL